MKKVILGDANSAKDFFRENGANAKLRVDSVMHLWNAIATGLGSDNDVKARVADGSLVSVCIQLEDDTLIITKND